MVDAANDNRSTLGPSIAATIVSGTILYPLTMHSIRLSRLVPHTAVKLTETEFTYCGRIARRYLEALRRESSAPVKVERMRRTRTGWAVIYRMGDGPHAAFKVDAWDDAPRLLTPEQAIVQWMSAS